LVSAIIPARNEEASIARAVESVAAQAEVGEVIVVDDGSTDRTADILQELAGRISKLKILRAGTLPPGWTGKNHAVSIGAAAAQGDWLLFTDADTYHFLGSTRRALSDAVVRDAVLVSYSPEQEMDSFWERALIPYVYSRLAARYSFQRVNDPKLPDAAANGQFLMILCDVYKAVGGHAADAGEVLEDVALARRVKGAGYGIYFSAPMGILRTRMYRTFEGMWQGWTKNLYPLMGGTFLSMLVEAGVFQLFAMGLVMVLWVHWAAQGHTLFRPLLIVLGAILICLHIRYAALLYRNLYRVSYIKYYVPGACLFNAALIASWWKNTRGSVTWKGRAYPARTR